MTGYKLGDRVVAIDYLRRVNIDRYLYDNWKKVRELLAEKWPHTNTTHDVKYPPTKLWIPASIHRAIYTESGVYINTDSRNNPSADWSAVTLPVDGMICRKVTLKDGCLVYSYEEASADWLETRRYTAYHVAYHLSRRPLIVLPSMIEPAVTS